MRVLRYILLLFLILAAFVLGATWTLLGTEPGSRWLVRQAQPFIPGQLTLEDFNGSLAGGFAATDIRWRNDADLEISLAQVRANLTLWRLLHGQVSAESLQITDLRIQLPSAPAPETEAPAGLPDIRLPLAIAIDEGRVNGLHIERGGDVLLALDRVAVEEARWLRRLKFEHLSVTQGELQAEASGMLMLRPPHQLDLSLDWALSLPEAVQKQLAAEQLVGQARLDGTLEEVHARHRLSAPFSITSTGTVQPFSVPLSLDVSSSWERIVVPGTDGAVILQDGRLHLSGSPDDLVASMSSRATIPPVGALQLEVEARGDAQKARSMKVKATRGDAQLQARGRVAWLPELQFDLALNGERIDPAIFAAGWPGRLNLNAQVRGGTERIVLRDVNVSGELRDRVVDATGRATLSGGNTELQADLAVGSNRASVAGTVGEKLDVEGNFDFDAPQVLLDDARGELAGRFAVEGTMQAPRLDLNASGASAGYAGAEVTEAVIEARNVGPASKDFSLSVSGNRFLLDGTALLENFALSSSGGIDDHTLNWALHNAQATVTGAAQGSLDITDEPGWSGEIQALRILPTQQGLSPWQLRQPAALLVSAQQVQLERACLDDGVGSLCASLRKSPERLAVEANIDRLPLALLKLVAPELPVAIQGHLNANASLLSRDEGLSGELRARTQQAALVLENHKDTKWRLDLDRLSADAVLKDDRLQVEGELLVRDHGSASLELTTSMSGPDAPLDGNLNIALDEWRWVSLFVPQVTDVSGALNGDIELAGTRRRPLLDGRMVLRNGTARVPEAGVRLREVHLKASGDGRRIALSGGGTSGPGSFSLTGALHPFPGSPQPLVSLAVNGERVEIVNLRDMHVLASPDLTLRLEDEVLHVRGEVVIPEAAITPEQPPRQAIQVSEDEVLVREREEPTGPGLALDMKVELILGEAVTFEGFGLEASPAGQVTVLQEPSRPLRLQGQLRLEEGRYRAYGQNLKITEGQLLFQNKPDNPGLNIRAVRRIPSANVEVGVELGGTLKQPEASIFSNPPMEESEAMAWLLTGRSLSGTSESENAQVAHALALYGLEKGSGITEEIGEKLGVDEISIGSTWETQDAALMLGKQLSDRLYLRYAAGLFNAISTVMLRYTLSRRLHLEATTGGNEQSLDLIYQFEK